MIGYVVKWKTKAGKEKTDVFLPLSSGMPSMTDIHLCIDAKATAERFAGEVSGALTERDFSTDLDVLTA